MAAVVLADFRVSHSDEVDAGSAHYFVNSSLAPVLLSRGRLKSVADVLKGIRSRGYTQSRWEASLLFWDAVCRHHPCGPICSFQPWDKWVPLGSRGFRSGCLMLWISWVILLSRLLSVAGILAFLSGCSA